MFLHWVFKIGNLKENLKFYDALGMKVLRHEEFSSGCDAQCNGAYSRPWSKTMVGYGPEKENFVFELTFNYGIKAYQHGNDLRSISLCIHNLQSHIQKLSIAGFKVEKVESGDGEEWSVSSPDGYMFHLLSLSDNNIENYVSKVSLNVSSLENSVRYYTVDVCGLDVVSSGKDECRLVYPGSSSLSTLELVQVNAVIKHEKAYGRLAIAVPDEGLEKKQEDVVGKGYKIHTPFVALETPGKATVQVVILQDVDDYEICMVGKRGFLDLCQPFEGCDKINWTERIENGSKEQL